MANRADLFIREDYSDCTSGADLLLTLNPAPGAGGGSVVVVDVDQNGVATQIFDATAAGVVTVSSTLVTVHLGNVPDEHTIMVYVKFGPGLKGQTFMGTRTCTNTNSASTVSAQARGIAATAHLTVSK